VVLITPSTGLRISSQSLLLCKFHVATVVSYPTKSITTSCPPEVLGTVPPPGVVEDEEARLTAMAPPGELLSRVVAPADPTTLGIDLETIPFAVVDTETRPS
jgi:hypothetical protein